MTRDELISELEDSGFEKKQWVVAYDSYVADLRNNELLAVHLYNGADDYITNSYASIVLFVSHKATKVVHFKWREFPDLDPWTTPVDPNTDIDWSNVYSYLRG